MGIFNSLPGAVGERTDKTVIAKGTRITGTIHTDVLLMIDGAVEGEVHSSTDVSVGIHGCFVGTMNAKHILVSGQTEGSITCDRLEILKSGVVNGDVVLRELTIESGGRFFGQSREAKAAEIMEFVPPAAALEVVQKTKRG
ncbi:MAG: polymer-forming cytoskeletal protein [Betaproteobacteria bacterium]|nr:polymer-forming cytoskeletal protein [Betaproteobacteria bacterium]